MPRKTKRGRRSAAKTARKNKSEATSKRKGERKGTEGRVIQEDHERASKRQKSEAQLAESQHNASPPAEQSKEAQSMTGGATSTNSETSKMASNPADESERTRQARSPSSSETRYKSLYEESLDNEHVEDREAYRIGGLHPVHIQDRLGENKRYEVLNKLGFGAHSTVWACLDTETGRLRAVKILRADHSTDDCPELRIQKIFKDFTEDELSDHHVVVPLECFWINGPNGRHLCLVLPLVGQSIEGTILGSRLHSPSMLKKLSYQIAKGTQFLHQRGICHGDLTPANVLWQMKRDDSLTIEDTYEILNALEENVHTYDIIPRSNKPSKHGAPDYLVSPVVTRSLTERFGTGKIALADFGLSYLTTDPGKTQKYPINHSSPGLMMGDPRAGLPDDVWSLACTVYHIVTKRTLFHEYGRDKYGKIEILEWLFGPLPAIYRRTAREIFTEAEKPDEKTESLGSPEDPSSETEPVSKLYMTEYDSFIKARPNHCRFLKDWAQPLQALLREPVWQEHGERALEALEALRQYKEATEKTGAAVTGSKSQSVKPDTPPTNGREPQGPNSEEQMQIRQQYDFIDQCHLPKGVIAYSIKRVEVLVLSDLLLQMFRLDPEKRINIDQVLDHPWFDDIETDPDDGAVWL